MIKKTVAAIAAFITGMTLWTAAAMAQTVGPLDGVKDEANGAKTDLLDFATTTGLPIIFGLLVFGLGVMVAVKYTRRGARAV